ncbi:MAG: zinc ribbon domain-containing protein, partial [Gammaproteobacteria bacterium]|nr:zinc ribbon domain-containing protein [Gammaproteobacteria bacterium]
EVSHRMSESLSTWGELCQQADWPLGDTAADTPVKKLITGGHVVSHSHLGSGKAPPCESGAPCCGGMSCGLN